MPEVRVYVRAVVYTKILQANGNDPKKVAQKIAEMVREHYG